MEQQIIQFLQERYPTDVVDDLFDDEVLNWVDEDWEEDYDSEYDWYVDHNNREAQEVVIIAIEKDIKEHFPNLSSDIELEEIILQQYSALQ